MRTNSRSASPQSTGCARGVTPWFTLSVAVWTTACSTANAPPPAPRPNIIVILADDLGYGDLGCFGATGFSTPHLDRMAREGMRLTSCYVPATVCTPSRAALLTGCYPKRVGLHEAVLFPYSTTGLNHDETTLAEELRRGGYRTGSVGKWHLGHQQEFLPLQHGFDEWFGVPYSNDMDGYYYKARDFRAPPLPLYRGNEIVESGPDQTQLTRRFHEAALEFIAQNRAEPFFLYLAHVMPHRPLHPGPAFAGSSELGVYGDVVQEIDDGVGQILEALEQHGIADNTIVFFTSDNGPVLRDRVGASAGPLRGQKSMTWEGGPRVPAIAWWPGQIPAGSESDRIFCTMDLLPTLTAWAGIERADDAPQIDGVDQRATLLGMSGGPPRTELAFYSRDGQPEAIRDGNLKLHVAKSRGWNGVDGPFGERLYDLATDPGETRELRAADIANQPILHRLRARLDVIDRDLTAGARAVGTAKALR